MVTTPLFQIEAKVHEFVYRHYRVTSAGFPPNMNHFLKFLVVRHPLDRLYSSYFDKFFLKADGTLPKYAKMSMKIHEKETKDKGMFGLFG